MIHANRSVSESESETRSVVSDSLRIHRLYCPWILQVRTLEGVVLPFSRESPGIEPRPPALQTDSSPAESQGNPKNTGVGSLSLPQWIFLTQESNKGLQHCRWILYQLSYQGSPECQKKAKITASNF